MNIINKLKGLVIKGDFAGRDINKTIILPPTQLDRLSEFCQKEIEENVTTNEFIDELNHYKTKKVEIRNLKEKLSEA